MVIFGMFLIAFFTWGNFHYVSDYSPGIEFTTGWLGTRLYLIERISPYSERVTHEIHEIYKGSRALEVGGNDFFASPHYSMLIYLPYTIVGEIKLARSLWMTSMQIGLLVIGYACMKLNQWRPSKYLISVYFLFSILWYHAFEPVISGNVSILITLFITLALINIRLKQDGLAGIFLGLSCLQPLMVVLLVPYIIFWALSHRRWQLIINSVGTFSAFVIGSLLLERNWIISYLRHIILRLSSDYKESSRDIFSMIFPDLGIGLGWALTIVLILILLFEWTISLKKDFHWFLWTASLTLVITNLIGIPTTPSNFIGFFPALILVFAAWENRWGGAGTWMVGFSMVILFVSLWFLELYSNNGLSSTIQTTATFFSVPTFVFICLYWVRWWVTKPKKLLADELSGIEIN
jgi:hypothetical protein